MPLYEYRCLGCGKLFSVVQSMREEALREHPDCGGAVQRLISGGRAFLISGKGAEPRDDDDMDFGGVGGAFPGAVREGMLPSMGDLDGADPYEMAGLSGGGADEAPEVEGRHMDFAPDDLGLEEPGDAEL